MHGINFMISKNNKYLQIKVSDKTFEFIDTFSKDFNVSISNFGEYCINSVIADLGHRTSDLNDVACKFFIQTFADNINNLYRSGKRSK